MGVSRYSLCLSFLFVLFSCNGNKSGEKAPEENIVNDALLLLEPDSNKVFYNEELYANADNSFYDFIYLFKSDSLFQRARISFPVKSEENGRISEITFDKWHFDSLLLNNVYYTQFYSSEEDIDEQSDKDISYISLRELYIKSGLLKIYNFGKKDGKWMLDGIVQSGVDDDDFISFFAKFVGDSLFQNEHLSRHLKFVTYDPEDEFSLIESELSSEQWNAFKPAILTDVISEFDYHKRNLDSGMVVASTVQIDTGYNIRLYFRKNSSKGWILYKYEDLSN